MSSEDVERFLQEQIDTVPHLEAFLLLWNSRPKKWTVDDMAAALYLAPESTEEILDDLVRRTTGVVFSATGTTYGYASDPARDPLIAEVDATYRRELIRVTRMIHSKPSAAVRAFARAFRLRKDK